MDSKQIAASYILNEPRVLSFKIDFGDSKLITISPWSHSCYRTALVRRKEQECSIDFTNDGLTEEPGPITVRNRIALAQGKIYSWLLSESVRIQMLTMRNG